MARLIQQIVEGEQNMLNSVRNGNLVVPRPARQEEDGGFHDEEEILLVDV